MYPERNDTMAKKTNCTINGKEYYRIYRKVGMKVNKMGIWVDDRKAFYGSCKKEAEEAYQEYMERKKSGQSVNTACLGQLIDRYIDAVFKSSRLSESTKSQYITAYEKLLQPAPLAGQSPDNISALDLQEFYNGIPEDKVSSGRNLHYFLRGFYRYAELQGICRDITGSLTPPRKTDADEHENFEELEEGGIEEIEAWEDIDLKKLLSSLDDHRLRLLVYMAVNTGARIGELLAISHDAIKDGNLYIVKQISEAKQTNGSCAPHIAPLKSKSSRRVIPLNDTVMREIKRHEAWQRREMMEKGYRTNFLFTTSTGKWYRRRNIKKSLDRLYKKIGVPQHKFHAFRHTFGTNLSRAGVAIEETSKLMGHSSIETTAKYYIHVGTDRKREAVESLSSFQ